jgi:hypothetical protein
MHVHDMHLLRVRNISATFEESTTSVVSCVVRSESLVSTFDEHRRKSIQEYTHFVLLRRAIRMELSIPVRSRVKMVIPSQSKTTSDGCRRLEHC